MAMIRRIKLLAALVMILIAMGCESADQRLAELSERAAQRQQEQNEIIARQSESVVIENQRIAAATESLIAADAKTRQEMIQAQRQLQSEIHAERAIIDQQRNELEHERRKIAEQRARDPIVAATIEGLFVLLACLTPLVIVACALLRLDHDSPEGDELMEVLLSKLIVSDQLPRIPRSLMGLPARSATLDKSEGTGNDVP